MFSSHAHYNILSRIIRVDYLYKLYSNIIEINGIPYNIQ